VEKNRLEAFSDGVLAIIITIMVLELKVPHGSDLNALAPLLPVFMAYVLSFIYLGIYWNNHHHLLKAAKRVNGSIMWANLHLLFWLSLFPFVTAWAGENHFASLPTACYGIVLFMAGGAYYLLQALIIADEGKDSRLAHALGRDFKIKLSLLSYIAGLGLAFYRPQLSTWLYVMVALMWLVPDKRLERIITER
jgi:uncharacterized membrane protein